MNRIETAFSTAKSENRAAFVAYVCAGDPDFQTSLEVCRSLIEGGTDILELGVPFSDPLADGLTNQLAAERALEAGMTQVKVFELVREILADRSEVTQPALHTPDAVGIVVSESVHIRYRYACSFDHHLAIALGQPTLN